MADTEAEARARRRWLAISASRLVGIGFVLIGLLVDNAVIPGPKELAYVLLGIGLLVTFVTPRVLAKQWRSPPE